MAAPVPGESPALIISLLFFREARLRKEGFSLSGEDAGLVSIEDLLPSWIFFFSIFSPFRLTLT